MYYTELGDRSFIFFTLCPYKQNKSESWEGEKKQNAEHIDFYMADSLCTLHAQFYLIRITTV